MSTAEKELPIDPNMRAEVFIRTLEEMLDHERACQKARLRRQVRTHVERFMTEFGTGPGSRRHVPAWPVESRPTGPEIHSRIRDE